MNRLLFINTKKFLDPKRLYVTQNSKSIDSFEHVFSLPSIKYMALLNRLKVYHMVGTLACVPTCGMFETLHIVPEQTSLFASYIGVTGFAVMSLASLAFRNVIGHLYINEDNKKIKISSLDFWGRRKDRIVDIEEWVPLLEMKPKTLDVLYLSPQLTDGTKYKLLVKFGKILNSTKIGQVLE